MEEMETESREEESKSEDTYTMKQLFMTKDLHMPLLVAVMLQVIQQLSGINAVRMRACRVTSHQRHGISNHWQLDCLFDSLLRLIIPKKIKVSYYWPMVTNGFLWQRARNVQAFLYHDVEVWGRWQTFCWQHALSSKRIHYKVRTKFYS